MEKSISLRTLPITTALIGWSIIVSSLSAWAADADKLRHVLPLPRTGFSLSYAVNTDIIVSSNAQDRAFQLGVLKEGFTGNDSDAGRWYRLGSFYSGAGSPEAKQDAYTHASTLYLSQIRKTPNDPSLLIKYSAILELTGEPDQSEAVLRRAVRLAPGDARAWAALGQILAEQVTPPLLTPDLKKKSSVRLENMSAKQASAFGEEAKDYRPKLEQIAKAQQTLDEAEHCFDKAVQVQPKASTGYFGRAGFRSRGKSILSIFLSRLRRDNLTLAAAVQEVSGSQSDLFKYRSAGVLTDYRQATAAAPDDLYTVYSALNQELSSAFHRFGETHTADQSWAFALFPADSQHFIESDLALMEHIAGGKDPLVTSQAASAAGCIRSVIQQNQKAERDYRRAIICAPQALGAYDGLIANLSDDQKYADAAVFAEQRVKLLDTAYNRVSLAKIYDKLNRPVLVEVQIQAALKVEPDNGIANIAELVLLLRRSDVPGVLPLAQRQLEHVNALYYHSPELNALIDTAVAESVCFALSGNEASARADLNQVLAVDKTNDTALKVLEILGPVVPQK